MQETHEIWVPSLCREDASGEGNGNLLQYSCPVAPTSGSKTGALGITFSQAAGNEEGNENRGQTASLKR